MVNAAGCGSAMKDYGDLLPTTRLGERAAAFSAKVRDVTELLAAIEPRAARHPLPLRVAYHDACHLAHAQGIRAPAARRCCAAIPGLELLEPRRAGRSAAARPASTTCVQPEAAAELGRRKAGEPARHRRAGDRRRQPRLRAADRLHLRELGHPLPIYHPIELLSHRSIRGERR